MIACLALSKSLGGRQAFAFTFTIILGCEQLSFTTNLLIRKHYQNKHKDSFQKTAYQGLGGVCCHYTEVSLTVLSPMIFHWQALGCGLSCIFRVN